MNRILLTEEEVLLTDQYRLISSTTTVKNRKGEQRKYTTYNCSFPYPFFEMLDFPSEIYIYERQDKTYITDEQPPDYYPWKKISLQTRKNQRQSSSSENRNKKWAKLMTIPKNIFGDMMGYKTLHYTLHCNKRDYVTNRKGLLEINLSKDEPVQEN